MRRLYHVLYAPRTGAFSPSYISALRHRLPLYVLGRIGAFDGRNFFFRFGWLPFFFSTCLHICSEIYSFAKSILYVLSLVTQNYKKSFWGLVQRDGSLFFLFPISDTFKDTISRKVEEAGFHSFNVIAATFIMIGFCTSTTSAHLMLWAESFNAKIKLSSELISEESLTRSSSFSVLRCYMLIPLKRDRPWEKADPASSFALGEYRKRQRG